MFQYLLSFLLINSYYQSLGSPIHSNHSMLESLTNLSKTCQNPLLVNAIKSKFNDCDVAVPSSNKKYIQCLIFYDINQQLCSASGDSKLVITEALMPKISEKQDVTMLCTQAKDWIFTNSTKFGHYKNKLEEFFKTPITCGEMCGGEENIMEANEFCKYYKWGVELLKSQISTTGSSVSNNLVLPPASKSDSDIKASIDPVKNPLIPEAANTNNQIAQIKQTESSDIPKPIPEKAEESGDVNEPNVVSEKLPNQTNNQETAVADNNDDLNGIPNELESPLKPDNVDVNEPSSKSTQTSKPVSGGQSDPMIDPESGKDKIELDPAKESDKDDAKGDAKSQNDLEYPESDIGDDENEIDEPQLEINPDKKSELITNKLLPKIDYNSHKEFYPNTSDGFTDDGDHFFPFFLTGIILVVLLYVLYHNKSKVSKVFFGLLIEGRQNGRRRNSRGHAYRRLDTLEQAMSANTAAPPSKIIY